MSHTYTNKMGHAHVHMVISMVASSEHVGLDRHSLISELKNVAGPSDVHIEFFQVRIQFSVMCICFYFIFSV